jgi:hypothetical protein
MARLTVQALSTAGLTPAFVAAATILGDEFLNDGHTFLYIKNSVAATNAVKIASKVAPVPKGLVAIDVTAEVSASGERMGGFFDQGAYNDSSGCVQLSYTTHTGLTLAAISVT